MPGPTIPNPPTLPKLIVQNGEAVLVEESIINSLTLYPGGTLTLRNVTANGWCHVMTGPGRQSTFNATGVDFPNHLRIDSVDTSLNHKGPSPITCVVDQCRLYKARGTQGSGAHLEALSGFGNATGIKFYNSTLIMQGPENGTQTAVVNILSDGCLFENCDFLWENGIAAWYTVYIDGVGSRVRGGLMQKGLANYVYPTANPPIMENVLFLDGTSTPPAPTPEPEPTPDPILPPTPDPEPIMPLPAFDFAAYAAVDPDAVNMLQDYDAIIRPYVDALEAQISGLSDQSAAIDDLETRVTAGGAGLTG